MNLEELMADVGATGYVHARDIDDDAEVGLNADTLVVIASVFKIGVALELARQYSSGELDPLRRVRVSVDDHVMGPTGLSGMLDEADLSLRDLSYLMMTVSDNTATDVIMNLVGLERVNATLRTLGLEQTVLEGDCRHLLGSLLEDLVLTPEEALAPKISELDPQRLRACRALKAEATTRSTPRETTRLLQMIWRDEAGPPEACAEVRRLMGLQVWRDRLSSGFGDEVIISAKTGTLPGIRNEAGVCAFPDGKRYAVVVFTVADTFEIRRPEIDHVIGRAARLAIDSLR